MGADPTKFGVGQYDSFHALTLTSQLVNDPTKGPAYNAPPKKENQNVFFFKTNLTIDRYESLI